MKVVVNDISFEYSLYNREAAMAAIHDFISVCGFLESNRCHNVNRLYTTSIDCRKELYSAGGTIYNIIQQIKDKDERSYLLALLNNRAVVSIEPKNCFVFEGHISYSCASAVDGIVVSIRTNPAFEEPVINGEINDLPVCLKNVSNEGHIKYHADLLGIRVYEANSEKHKKDRDNPYGKGRVGSPMDLSDDDAQVLLDKAINVNGKLYARKGSNSYEFKKSLAFTYHGYINSGLTPNIIAELNRHYWD